MISRDQNGGVAGSAGNMNQYTYLLTMENGHLRAVRKTKGKMRNHTISRPCQETFSSRWSNRGSQCTAIPKCAFMS